MEETCLWYTTSTTSTGSETSTTKPGVETTTDGALEKNMYFYLYGYTNKIVNLDGSYNDGAIHIEYPHDNFSGNSVVVDGVLYVIGEHYNHRSIYKLEDCSFIETKIRMNFDFNDESAMLSINNGTSALICFESWNELSRNCEIFDGKTVETTESTIHTHGRGSLGLYKGQPTAFGTDWTDNYTGARKVEMFNETTEWIEMADHPLDMCYVTLVGLENGALLSMGGKFNINENYPWKTQESLDIWILEDNVWSVLGLLQKPIDPRGISLVFDSSIYVFGYKMLRIEIENTKIISQEDLGYVYNPKAYLRVERGFCFDPRYESF